MGDSFTNPTLAVRTFWVVDLLHSSDLLGVSTVSVKPHPPDPGSGLRVQLGSRPGVQTHPMVQTQHLDPGLGSDQIWSLCPETRAGNLKPVCDQCWVWLDLRTQSLNLARLKPRHMVWVLDLDHWVGLDHWPGPQPDPEPRPWIWWKWFDRHRAHAQQEPGHQAWS